MRLNFRTLANEIERLKTRVAKLEAEEKPEETQEPEEETISSETKQEPEPKT